MKPAHDPKPSMLDVEHLCFARGEACEPFSTLTASSETLRALQGIAVRKCLRAGKTLFWEGDPAKYIYKLVRGAAKGFKLLPNGSSQITRFYIPGEMVSITYTDSYCCTVEALTGCELVQYPRTRFEEIVDSDPKLRRALSALVARELQETQKQVLLLGRMSAIERVTQFLVDFGNRVAKSAAVSEVPEPVILELPMTRADIADYLGLTIETVSRIFTKFRKDGFIDLARPNEVRFRNPAWFQGQAQALAA